MYRSILKIVFQAGTTLKVIAKSSWNIKNDPMIYSNDVNEHKVLDVRDKVLCAVSHVIKYCVRAIWDVSCIQTKEKQSAYPDWF